MDIDRLLEMIGDDKDGILDVAENMRPRAVTEDERLIESFMEIISFYEKHQTEPVSDFTDMQEWKLYTRLKGFRESKEKIKTLLQFDKYNLLILKVDELSCHEAKEVYKVPENLSDILSDDDFGLLEDEEDIFTLKHIAKDFQPADTKATRKACSDFGDFEHYFTECHCDLQEGRRRLVEFSQEQKIFKGQFFILKGVMVYIAEVHERVKKRGKTNARLRCIYENGTESNLLLRSLSRELYRNGRRITEHDDELFNELKGVGENDVATGRIYVLRSLSKNSEISALKDLYKIGFTRTSVNGRLQNASKEPTYLMADVQLVCEFECFNMNPQKFEHILHKLFGHSCLNVDVFDQENKRYVPREWFIVPLKVIESAVHLILTGEIVNYYYDVSATQLKIRMESSS